MQRGHLSEVLRFCVVGGIGFLIDAGILLVFSQILDLSPFIWRFFSFLVASIVTWSLHRHFTFDLVVADPLRQWVRFTVFNGVGAALNLLIYSLLLLHGAPPLHHPIVAVFISSTAALFYNFTASKYLVFASD